MCSPEVARIVRDRIQREGLPIVSRRNFLKLGGGLVAASSLGAAAPVLARPHAYGHKAVIDMSHALNPAFPVFPAFQPASVETLVTVEENGFYAQRWSFGEHTSTHMDFPAHFIADGERVDQYDPMSLVGRAVVIDISSRVTPDNPDAMLMVEDLEAWEEANGEIPSGAFVFMYSGWETRLNEEGAYLNQAEDGTLHFPGFSKEAAEFLVSERTIRGIGVDTLSLDVGSSTTFDVHLTILSAGLLGLENVANLAKVKDEAQVTVVCGIPKYENGSGGPARILGLVADE
jgi:kynurenine formamidase